MKRKSLQVVRGLAPGGLEVGSGFPGSGLFRMQALTAIQADFGKLSELQDPSGSPRLSCIQCWLAGASSRLPTSLVPSLGIPRVSMGHNRARSPFVWSSSTN